MFRDYKISWILVAVLLACLMFSNHQNKMLKDEIIIFRKLSKTQELTIKELEAEIIKNEQIINDLKKIKPKKEIVLQRIKDEKTANDKLSDFYANFYECLREQNTDNICKAKDK